MKKEKDSIYVPVWEKYALTIPEAAAYFGIGEQRIRSLVFEEESNPSKAKYFFMVGNRIMIKRLLFEKYLNELTSL